MSDKFAPWFLHFAAHLNRGPGRCAVCETAIRQIKMRQAVAAALFGWLP